LAVKRDRAGRAGPRGDPQFGVGLMAGKKRIAIILSVLRLALAQTVQDNVLELHVLDGWSYTKSEPIRETDEVDVFTAEEQARSWRSWRRTGLRTSEMSRSSGAPSTSQPARSA
jgi:hypothetical protein